MARAFVLVRVGSSDVLNFMKAVKEEICKVKRVKGVQTVFGRYDFVVRVEAKTLEALGNLVADCIRSIKGVTHTETLVMGSVYGSLGVVLPRFLATMTKS